MMRERRGRALEISPASHTMITCGPHIRVDMMHDRLYTTGLCRPLLDYG